MEDVETMLGVVLEQARHDLLCEADSPGPTHAIAVIELDQESGQKIGIRYYWGPKKYVVASRSSGRLRRGKRSQLLEDKE